MTKKERTDAKCIDGHRRAVQEDESLLLMRPARFTFYLLEKEVQRGSNATEERNLEEEEEDGIALLCGVILIVAWCAQLTGPSMPKRRRGRGRDAAPPKVNPLG